MKFQLVHGLPFVDVMIEHQNQQLIIQNVLVDTGSATTIFSTDLLATINVKPHPNDDVHRISGVGGYEYVIQKLVDKIYLEDAFVENYQIQLGDLDYGFDINGIIGADFLNAIGITINFTNRTLSFDT